MPSYKLTYFDIPGRAEPIRLLLNYGKIPFTDNRISKDDWAAIKPTTPFGQVPVLEIDGVIIPQSNAICRYVATLVGLAGKVPKENLAIDIVAGALEDLQKISVDIRMSNDEEKKQENKKKFNEKLAVILKKLDVDAKKNGGYLALNRLTWIDIIFINSYEGFVNVQGEDVLNGYPSLQQVKKNVLSVESIKNYIKSRPGTPRTGQYELKQDL